MSTNYTKMKLGADVTPARLAEIHSIPVGKLIAKEQRPSRKVIEVYDAGQDRCVVVRHDKAGPVTWMPGKSASWFAAFNRIPLAD